ncbi:Sodium/solute symporter [Penicillium cf. griseofulvum]|uniref:Sodium/solute symporter n=1 Tax=Penicillium cf. griseofulvum TaxID=2972120 RepID=A0A9W9J7A0_9EURO|nr:Sodium/solute symporter [Penicillium cf. griseofulvum]KAJ5434683.1 Sodium/solute symporter [Penicillium cf. griseofulvum]KAJ5452513.1 Sodium/solute symporter [Penicillium cf. griseofulvum]
MPVESQNIYDTPEFFLAYGNLPRSQHGLRGAPEWPVLEQMILNPKSSPTELSETPLKGSRILDLGCGYGWFIRWAREKGAGYIKGVDISQNMINRAKEFEAEINHQTRNATKVTFEIQDLETINLSHQPEQELYDIVYSSLAFHYIEDIVRLFREIHRCLKKGSGHERRGRLIFSVEHPIVTAPVYPGPDFKVIRDAGEDRMVWPLNSYRSEGLRLSSWLGSEGVRKYHRTVETYVTALLENGFVLTGLKDWCLSKEDIAGKPEWKGEGHRPYFLLISAEVRE